MQNIDPKKPVVAQPTESAGQRLKERRPNDQGTVIVQAHMKIFDPNTKQTYVEGRAWSRLDWPESKAL